MNRRLSLLLTAVVLLSAVAGPSLVSAAQQNAPTRNILSKQDLSTPGYEGIVAQVDFAPGAQETPHTHPGDVFVNLQEGTVLLHIEGKPDVTLSPGQVGFIPANAVHWGQNTGTTPARVLATFVVPKGKPLTTPAK